jgi:hypothetical protein
MGYQGEKDMRIKSGSLISIGVAALFLSLLSKIIRNSEKREELKYWIEYHANKLGLLETEKHKN